MMCFMKSSPTTTASMTPTHNKVKQQVKEETQRRYRPLHFQTSGHCTFCGAPMEPGDTVCEECGMPADGVVWSESI